jgi:hypothetical protein
MNIERETSLDHRHQPRRRSVPANECFDICSNAWGSYINGSLRSLIITVKATPTRRKNNRQAPMSFSRRAGYAH